jgi:hypothetical protein
MKTKVTFKVIFTPSLATKIFTMMSWFDLGITGGEYPTCYHYSGVTTEKVDEKYIKKMKSAIRKGLKKGGVTQIHSIEFIKI